MFKDLYAVARHTPLHLIITPNGEQLRIIVTPKPTGDAANNAALAKPFSAVGTPEELDREFPEALRTYTGAVNDLRTSINLPIDLLDAAKKKAAEKETKAAEKKRQEEEEAKRRSESATKAAATRAQKADEERKAKEAKELARAEAKAAKKAGRAKPAGSGIELPGAAAAASTSAPAATNGLPGKEQCVADYQQLRVKHGDKLTRRLFIKKAKTGRRYEKLWKNFEAFVQEAGAQAELPLAAAAATTEPYAVLSEEFSKTDYSPARAALPAEAATDKKSEAAPSVETAGDGSRPAETTPAPAPEMKFAVYTEGGEFVRGSKYPFAMGERLEIAPGGEFVYVITSVDSADVHRYTAQKRLSEDIDFVLESGELIGCTDAIYLPGDKVADHPLAGHGDFRVVNISEAGYIVRDFAKPRWTVWNPEGAEIGNVQLEAEPAAGDKIDVGEHKGLTVITVDGFDITAAVVKPRIKGPAAVTAATTE